MPKPQQAHVRIVIDHREEASGIPNALRQMENTEVVSMAMPHGDYELAPGFVCERKSGSDFSSSIIDRRLWSQVEARREAGVRSVILIDSDPYNLRGGRGGIHPKAIDGAISHLAVNEGIPVLIRPGNAVRTAELIQVMSRHAQTGLGYLIDLAPPKPKTLRDQQLHSVQSLPGIGPAKAALLLEHFGSVFGVMQASAEQIGALPGFSIKSGAELRRMLDHPFGSA